MPIFRAKSLFTIELNVRQESKNLLNNYNHSDDYNNSFDYKGDIIFYVENGQLKMLAAANLFEMYK